MGDEARARGLALTSNLLEWCVLRITVLHQALLDLPPPRRLTADAPVVIVVVTVAVLFAVRVGGRRRQRGRRHAVWRESDGGCGRGYVRGAGDSGHDNGCTGSGRGGAVLVFLTVRIRACGGRATVHSALVSHRSSRPRLVAECGAGPERNARHTTRPGTRPGRAHDHSGPTFPDALALARAPVLTMTVNPTLTQQPTKPHLAMPPQRPIAAGLPLPDLSLWVSGARACVWAECHLPLVPRVVAAAQGARTRARRRASDLYMAGWAWSCRAGERRAVGCAWQAGRWGWASTRFGMV